MRFVLSKHKFHFYIIQNYVQETEKHCKSVILNFEPFERVTGRKVRDPQVAEGNELQVAEDFVFVFPSLHKIKRVFF